MTILKIIALLCSAIGLLFAYGLSKWVGSLKIENESIKEISRKIKHGSRAFLLREYKSMFTLILILFVIIGIGIGWKMALMYAFGAFLSMVSGYFGVEAAAKGNAKTANIAMTDGIKQALKVTFRSGAVMGLCAACLALAGISIVYFAFGAESAYYVVGFAFGASTVSLMARIGGGIYVKASEVGTEIVGRLEEGMIADDPRNPSAIADNVGKSVGGVAGMGLDMFESYVSAIIAAIVIAIMMPTAEPTVGAGFEISASAGSTFPLILAAVGIISSIIGMMIVRGNEKLNPAKSLTNGFLVSIILVVIAAFIFSKVLFGNFNCAFAVMVGIITSVGVGKSLKMYTSEKNKYVKKLIEQSGTGAGILAISGIGLGMISTLLPVLCIAANIVIANYFAGIYGIAISAVGIISNMAMSVAVNACEPIAGNARGIAEIAGVPYEAQKITDKLKFVGSETIKMGRGISITSAAVTASALFIAYIQIVAQSGNEQYAGFSVNLVNPMVLAGILIGAMLPFLISALTMNSVGKAAKQMIIEVRNQFKERDAIAQGTKAPDYSKCINISTKAAVNEMLFPGITVMIAPIILGIFLGCEALAGMIAGTICSGIVLSIMMINSGEAWNNVKQKIEVEYIGKVDESYKAAVEGDLLGDAFRDVSGPAINILIKLMTIVSIIFVSWFIAVGGLINFL